MARYGRWAAMALAAAVLQAGCAGKKKEELAYIERPAEVIYAEAFDKLETKRYIEAAKLFDEVERQHPYSEWARRAMVMGAFAHYQNNNYDDAIKTAERYVALYPSGETTAYAYYLISLCHFERILDVGRDQRTTQLALDSLRQVARRFPTSDYARDARLKIDMTLDQLAGKEMEIGRWYLRQGQHLAAINRFKTVIADYGQTSHVPEALHRLVEAYVTLGIIQEATQVAAVLGYNFPGNRWYEDSYVLLAKNGVVVDERGQPSDTGKPKRRGWWDRTLGRFF